MEGSHWVYVVKRCKGGKGEIAVRTLAISDIHGCLDELNLLLHKVSYDPQQDKLVLLGDYVDRGPNSRGVVEQVKAFKEKWGVITLRGNHDQMMYDAIVVDSEPLNARWIRNGARQTLESYCGADFFGEGMGPERYAEAKSHVKNHYMHHLEFLGGLDFYHETDTHIFVHAGINPQYENWKDQPQDDFIWIREPFFQYPTGRAQKVVFGHTPVSYLHESDGIWFSPMEDKIGIDGGCAFGKQLHCLEIGEHGEYKMYSVRRGESPQTDGDATA